MNAEPLRAKPVDKIETADVLAVLRPIWQSKPETASRLRGRIERILNAAKAKGYRTGENPAAWRGHLENLFPKQSPLSRGHHAAMPYKDVPAFVAKLREREAVAALALEFAILPRLAPAKFSARDGWRSTSTPRSGPSRPSA